MPNIKSAKKRAKQSEVRRERNNARKSAVKTAIKRVLEAIENKEFEQATEFLKDAQQKIARAKSKGVLHKNTADRKISVLAKKVVAAQKS